MRRIGSAFFLSLPWFRHLAATTSDPKHHLKIYGAKSDSLARAVLPMCYATPSFFSLQGNRLTALANFYTPLFAPITCRPSIEAEPALRLLIQSIAEEVPRWDSIDLHPLDASDTTLIALETALRTAGMAVQRYFCFGNWYLPVNGRSYQEYFTGLPPKLQHTLTRKSKQLEQTTRLRIEIIQNEVDLEKSISAYEEIYRSSWKRPEAFPSFIPELIRLCCAHKVLRLGIAYIDDRPAAAQFWIVHNQVASIYKLAYKEEFSRLSVGSILTSRLMRHVIDVDRVREVDYLSGDDAYKRDWMSHRRERWGIIAFNLRTFRGLFLALMHLGGRWVKNFFKNPV